MTNEENDDIHCPSCNEPARRVKRKAYMKLLPFSRHIYCNACHYRYLKVFDMYIKLKQGNII